MLRFLRNNRGLSLLEILLATALLGITAGPLLGGLDQGLAGISSSGRRTVATQLACADLEKLQSVWEGAYKIELPPKEEFSLTDYPGFRIVREAVIEEKSPNGGEGINLIKVTVVVIWQEHNREEEIRLASFLVGGDKNAGK